MTHPFETFREKRKAGNEKALDTDNLMTKRFFSLDKQAYGDGALNMKTKELLGLVASMVLRCNDCIDYHLENCVKAGYTKAELDEAMGVAMLVGGSIVIPHLRHAAESLEFLFEEHSKEQS
ncbi:carboxymuconolactone decarboxylase family protein [Pleionea sp. CnH1-48]|uniref:carboxymuconolactone decarboxylase family protein n=1 Tax=Pleionea sp. CnH1-48 TaxID=2954494 RepID=UPI0020982D20|nr:carboxymuconolactone decarboxylase family protein [Pleionea sp. CnH1-48]MCO7222899.1 carboxymuconolactone decarboxylase family protein [Pleionea sp. CnH1-48]